MTSLLLRGVKISIGLRSAEYVADSVSRFVDGIKL